MVLLRAVEGARGSDSFPLRWSSAQEAASTPEESYDTASPFRGRKSRHHVDCCKTSALPAIDVRPDPRWLAPSLIRIARERFVPPNAAGWQSARNAGKTVVSAFRRARDRRQSFALPRQAAESPHP